MSVRWNLNRYAALLAGVALLVMALVGAADVVSGRGFSAPIPGILEFTESLMVISVFLALALAQQQRRHIRVELLAQLLPPKPRAALAAASALLTMLFFALIAWYGWYTASYSWAVGEFKSGQINFPVWPARIALAIGATLMVLQTALDAIHAVGRIWHHDHDGD